MPGEHNTETRRFTRGDSITIKELTETRKVLRDLINSGTDVVNAPPTADQFTEKWDSFKANLRSAALFLGGLLILIVPSLLLR